MCTRRWCSYRPRTAFVCGQDTPPGVPRHALPPRIVAATASSGYRSTFCCKERAMHCNMTFLNGRRNTRTSHPSSEPMRPPPIQVQRASLSTTPGACQIRFADRTCETATEFDTHARQPHIQ